jgi:translation initiation factor 3 subunit M
LQVEQKIVKKMAAAYIDFSSEEEQALSLAQFLNNARTKGKEPDTSFYDSCAKIITEKQYMELWQKLLQESPILFVETPEKDIEGFFAVVASLLRRLGVDAVHQTVPKLLAAITHTPDDKPVLRLKLLGNVYNILDVSPKDRYVIFDAVISFAIATKHPEILLHHFKDIERRVAEWGIDQATVRALYKRIRDVHKLAHHSAEAHKWTVKYLSTFQGSSEEQTTEAVNAALDAIRSTDLYQFDDLLDVPSIKQLEKDPKHAKLYQLLTIFVGENFDSFKAFTNANPDYLKQLGLNEEDSARKIKYLSLASLGSLNHELPYATIAKTLQIPENEVEMWVISAMSEGILEAKMDQIKGTVRVTRSIQRVFTRAQWKFLGDNLSVWKKNVQILLQTLQDCKHQTQLQAIDLSRGPGGDVTQS